MNKRPLTIKAFVAMALWLFVGRANVQAANKNAYTEAFLNVGVGARAVAMAEAQVSVVNDASAIYWNPAALTRVVKRSLFVMHSSYLQGSNVDYGAYAESFHQAGTAALAVERTSVGKITGRDLSGNETGDFSPSDSAIDIAYARPIGIFPIGVGVKFVRSKIVDTAQTHSFDIGMLSPLMIHNRVVFGVAATNIVGRLKFDKDSEPLPTTYKAGVALQVHGHWLITAEEVVPKYGRSYTAAGTDYGLFVGQSVKLAVRAGYTTKYSGERNEASGISLGFGFQWKGTNIDYAMVPFGDLGNIHRISFTWGF